MTRTKICLASDNWTPAHPDIIQAIIEANAGFTPSYGADPWTERAQILIEKTFGSRCKTFIVPTGTGANIFAFKLSCKSYESIICSDISHIEYQESGATEAITGCKLLTIPSSNGKITPDAIQKKLLKERAFGRHSTSPRLLSIAQPTEMGTVYSLQELAELSAMCRQENLLFHIDGSRLYNAVVSLNTSLETIVQTGNIDTISLGGTKNGLMGAEALVIFNKTLESGSDHLQKQTLQLLSKMRYTSAQFIPFFAKGLWEELASQANQKAKELAKHIEAIPDLSLSAPVETNQIFFTAPPEWIPLIQEEIFCYLWNHEKHELRFITSWCTTSDDIAAVKRTLEKIEKGHRF